MQSCRAYHTTSGERQYNCCISWNNHKGNIRNQSCRAIEPSLKHALLLNKPNRPFRYSTACPRRDSRYGVTVCCRLYEWHYSHDAQTHHHSRWQPTVFSFELVISALARQRSWRRALQLLEVMDDVDIPKTVVTYNTVISACARGGEVGTAKNLLAKMKRQGVKPNVITFNSLMSACASTSRWKDALSLLDQCHREPGVQPDIITYTNGIRACARGRQTNRALTLLQVVKDLKLPIDNYCYTAVIDGERCG